MTVTVTGYSERGMITAMCADLLLAEEPLALAQQLLSQFQFPLAGGVTPFACIVSRVKVLIEQSFSSFGCPDVVLLIDTSDGNKHSLFVEAKVHTDVPQGKGIDERWRFFDHFISNPDAKRGTSSLFAQMYRQQRFIQWLQFPSDLPPADRVRRSWNIGKNCVVQKAVKLVTPYASSGWVAALLPDEPVGQPNLESFFTSKLRAFDAQNYDLPGWNVDRWGYLTWQAVKKLCCASPNLWVQTRAAFEWNEGQIICVSK